MPMLLSFAGAPLSAVLQVETATVGGAATADADVIVTVTAAGVTGSPYKEHDESFDLFRN